MGLNNLKKEKEQGEILALFLLQGIKNSYNKTLENVLTNQLDYTIIKKGQELKTRRKTKMENTYELKGSEKQITWATDILNDVMGTISRNIEISKERNQERDVRAFETVKNKINKIIEQKKEASFYITNRNAFNPHTVIKTAEEIRNRM